ncbi:MAG: hypothetical protein QXN56_03265 [Candidatus Hadarchaeum sp.]
MFRTDLSALLEKLRIAGPDLAVGLMGVPIAFTFQRIADGVRDQGPLLSPVGLYSILGLLIVYYLVFALALLDLFHGFERLSKSSRLLQVVFALSATVIIFMLGVEARDTSHLRAWLAGSVLVVALMRLPEMIRPQLLGDDPVLEALLIILMFLTTLVTTLVTE